LFSQKVPTPAARDVDLAHFGHVHRIVGLLQAVRGGEGVRELLGYLLGVRAACECLDGSRSTHVLDLALLVGAEDGGAHFAKISAEPVLGVWHWRPCASAPMIAAVFSDSTGPAHWSASAGAEDWRGIEQLDLLGLEFVEIGVKQSFSPLRVRLIKT
jgi:hypothetical protein